MPARIVSVGMENGLVRVRRYVSGNAGKPQLTHEGAYNPESLSQENLFYYLANGAPQDLVSRRSRAA